MIEKFNQVVLMLDPRLETLDYRSIIELLSGWYGVSGTALNWVCSYLSNRVQRVKLLDTLGEPFKTAYGVPQGSVPDHSYSLYIQRP